MTINAQTAVVSWINPVGSVTPYTITIQAENPLGTDQASWQISVLSSRRLKQSLSDGDRIYDVYFTDTCASEGTELSNAACQRTTGITLIRQQVL